MTERNNGPLCHCCRVSSERDQFTEHRHHWVLYSRVHGDTKYPGGGFTVKETALYTIKMNADTQHYKNRDSVELSEHPCHFKMRREGASLFSVTARSQVPEHKKGSLASDLLSASSPE